MTLKSLYVRQTNFRKLVASPTARFCISFADNDADANNNTPTFSYDRLDRVSNVTDAMGRVTS